MRLNRREKMTTRTAQVNRLQLIVPGVLRRAWKFILALVLVTTTVFLLGRDLGRDLFRRPFKLRHDALPLSTFSERTEAPVRIPVWNLKSHHAQSLTSNQVDNHPDHVTGKQLHNHPSQPEDKPNRQADSQLHLTCVVCNNRPAEALVTLKSAVMFSHKQLVIHIFTDAHLRKNMSDVMDKWQDVQKKRVTFRFYDIVFPASEDGGKWRQLFKPCASVRLFMPTLLPRSVTATIYVDVDVLFLSPVEDVWQQFRKFNSTQLAAMAPEHLELSRGWYNRFAKHPYYGKQGVNSGFLLVNLTRIRSLQTSWTSTITALYHEYMNRIPWGDQDLLNIYFGLHPDQLYLLSCEWNFRPDFCKGDVGCPESKANGVRVLHGNRRVFVGTRKSTREPAFQSVYQAFLAHTAVTGFSKASLINPARKFFEASHEHRSCNHFFPKILQSLEQFVH